MGNPIYVIAYDVGTTGVKTCLFSITDKIELLGAASEGYNLYVYPDGGAEQDPDEWWEASLKGVVSFPPQNGIGRV